MPAGAFVPGAKKVVGAAAAFNQDAGRSVPLRLGVVLRSEEATAAEGDALAVGELLSDPRGLARLELRGAREARERHLLRGAQLLASRDGGRLARPRAYLPPLPLLQAGAAELLLSELRALGVDVGQAELGRSDGADCYVVGGLARGRGDEPPPPRAALWVDVESHAIVRIDRADGVSFRLGPARSFGRLLLPAWFSVRAPGEPPVRLEVREASPAEPSAADFESEWLLLP